LRHRDRLPELARLGCAFVVSAAESLSDTVLAHLDKGHTRTDIETTVRLVTAAGMALRPTWVPFTPWTTLDDYRELLDFVESHELIDAIDPTSSSTPSIRSSIRSGFWSLPARFCSRVPRCARSSATW